LPRHAALYVAKLPKADRELPQWETAIEWLMLVCEHGGDPMVLHIATVKALQQREPKAAPRRKPAKAYEPLLISTEDSTGKVCTDERNALAFPKLGLCPRDSLPKGADRQQQRGVPRRNESL
jgi:hypothetical protein